MSRSKRQRLLLIDGSSQMYRAYHAIRGLTGPDGRSTNAVYGFITMLRKLIADQQPGTRGRRLRSGGSHVSAGAGRRLQGQPRTDAARPGRARFPGVHQACEALGVPVVTFEGYEADDVIGTLATHAVKHDLDVVIVTGDKDFFQLVTDGITVFNPRDEGTWYDEAGVGERFGVRPNQVVDVLSLMGDAIDNVKGVPGIGEKGARALIVEHGSLDALLAKADTLPQRKHRESLTTHADLARQSRDLVRIHTDVPIEFQLERYRYVGPTSERCFELFSTLGFRSLLTEYAPTAESVTTDYQVLRTLDELEGLVEELVRAGRFALHVTSNSSVAMQAGIIGLSFATSRRAARYLPLGHTSLDARADMTEAQALGALARVLEDPAVMKVGHELKFAALVLQRHGVTLQGLSDDTMLASYVLDAHEAGSSTRRCLAGTDPDTRRARRTTSVGEGRKHVRSATFRSTRPETMACERADVTLQVSASLETELTGRNLSDVYRTLELPLIPVLMDIERAGVRIDSAKLAAQSKRLDADLTSHRARIFRAGRRGVQHQLSEATVGNLVRQAQPAGAEADRQDPCRLDSGGRARGARADPRAAASDPGVASAPEAQEHLHRRPPAARASRHRAGAHVVQSGGRGHRAPELQ